MEIVPSYRPAAVQPMEMLSCLECGDPIRYALNPHVSIRFDTSPPSLKYGDRKVDSTYRAFVGDFCDRCALQYASDADRPSMLRDLESIRHIQRQFRMEPVGTFQNFMLSPPADRNDLRGFTLETIGFWAVPIAGARHSWTFQPRSEPPFQFLELFQTIRHPAIAAELYWIRDNYERIEISNDERASVAQLKHLMNGLRFLREFENGRAGVGGRPPKQLEYEDAAEIWHEMKNEVPQFFGPDPNDGQFLQYIRENHGHLQMGRDTFTKNKRRWQAEGASVATQGEVLSISGFSGRITKSDL